MFRAVRDGGRALHSRLERQDRRHPRVRIAARGYRYEYAFQTMKEIPYGRWREYDPEDTVRFYALRLHEAGMLKSNPQKLIARATDWRFLNELKKELKA